MYSLLLAFFALLAFDLISPGSLLGLLLMVGKLDNAITRGNHQLKQITRYLKEYFANLSALLQAGSDAKNIFGAGLFKPIVEVQLLTTPINRIEFDNVYFTYPNYSIGLRHASVTINQGEIVALVGPNGAGKSTFIKLLLGIYFSEKGRVLIDGNPLHKDNVYHWWMIPF